MAFLLNKSYPVTLKGNSFMVNVTGICGNVSLRHGDKFVRWRRQDVTATFLQRHYNINQWIIRRFYPG